VLDTPISESAFIGAAVGAAATGLRPVAELMFIDFVGVCLDQILNQAAKLRYMFGGRATVPLVIRTMYGAGLRAASQHSQSLYPIFTHIPGLAGAGILGQRRRGLGTLSHASVAKILAWAWGQMVPRNWAYGIRVTIFGSPCGY